MSDVKMERQEGFRGKTKILAPVVKGSSTLNMAEFNKYDTSIVCDDLAKCSKKVTRSNIAEYICGGKGDEDVWVEKLLTSTITGQKRVFFVSKKTGRKVAGEPPSGAGRVFYLKPEYKEMKLKESSSIPKRSIPKTENKVASPASPASVVTTKPRTSLEICGSVHDSGYTDACIHANSTDGRPTLERSDHCRRHIRPELERSDHGTKHILADFLFEGLDDDNHFFSI